MSDSNFRITTLGEDGAEPPIMLAVRKPGQVAAQPDSSGAVIRRGAQSGNPNFDPVTGKFAGKKLRNLQVVAQTAQAGGPPQRAGTPTGVDPLVWERRLDAVRDAARQLDDLTEDTARTFLAARVADVNAVDLGSFINDVRWQRLADLADVLDQSLHGGQSVKVVANRQWVSRVFNGLSGPEAGMLLKRLEGRGWDAADINKRLISKMRNPQLKAAAQQLYGEAKPKSGKKEEKK